MSSMIGVSGVGDDDDDDMKGGGCFALHVQSLLSLDRK